MANISAELAAIQNASRGEEVRDSIIDALEAINSQGADNVSWDVLVDTPTTVEGYGITDVEEGAEVNTIETVKVNGTALTPDADRAVDITSIPASIISGVLSSANIPPEALERVVPVANDTARFALTTADVQEGDTVKVIATEKMYLVVDTENLDSEAGYEVYKAGRAAAVDWGGVENTPTTIAGYGITDAYAKSGGDALEDDVDDLFGDIASAETSPAASNHTVGSYLIYNNKLYKVLTAISSGESLTVGTNIGQTNVAAELASQANSIGFLKGLTSATAGFHNGIYRGKNISSYLTDGTLWKRINGSDGYELFEDLYIGDYIVVNGRSYTIVDFDYYIRTGSVDLNVHHLVMMPTGNMNIPAGTVLYGIVPEETLTFINTVNAGIDVSSQESATVFKWNATMADPNTHTTAGGYKYSRMRRVIMKAAETLVINDFGSSHVKPITVIYHNPASKSASGVANTWTWFNVDDRSDPLCKSICDLPNETQVYGQQVWGRGSAYTNMGYEVGIDKWQFSIFALQRNFANIRSYWWLRSVLSASGAALVGNDGRASYNGSAYALGVRPRFLLVG